MCLYMSVPLWINVERLTTAVSATASQLLDVSLVLFLLNCKSTVVAARTTTTAAAAAAATATAETESTTNLSSLSSSQLSALSTTTTTKTSLNTASHYKCKQLKQQQPNTQINPLETTKPTTLKTTTVAAAAAPASSSTNLIDLTPTATKNLTTNATTKSFQVPVNKIQHNSVQATHNINILVLDEAGV